MTPREDLYDAFLIKYAEIGIKGNNRYIFEDALVSHICRALKGADGDFKVRKENARIYVQSAAPFDFDDAVERIGSVFGVAGICPLVQFPKGDVCDLKQRFVEYALSAYPGRSYTFKVQTRRADKSFPLDSNQINAMLGEALLEATPLVKVDVHDPDVMFFVEIRKSINLYSEVIPGPGGIPVGTSGKATLLLSGGIDSPVAGYMTAKRGVTVNAVYFHAPPYTSERAKEKVKDLARLLSRYTGPVELHIVNFTDIQLYIYEKCPHDELTIIMRRYMMRIAQAIAEQTGAIALITGESIGQVASQTLPSLACTNEVCTMPVIRPVIGMDKQEIIDLSKKIGTFETSILPYEDCCTIFVAKHPVTKPNPRFIRRSEEHLAERIGEMTAEALSGREIVTIG